MFPLLSPSRHKQRAEGSKIVSIPWRRRRSSMLQHTSSCPKPCRPRDTDRVISQRCLQIGHLSLSASPNSVNLLMGLPQAVVDMLTLGSKCEQLAWKR